MNQVHPETRPSRKSKSKKHPKVRSKSKVAPEDDIDRSAAKSNGEIDSMVYENEVSKTINHEDLVINKVLENQNPVFREENELEEKTLMDRVVEPTQLHEEYARKATSEEDRLRAGFVDKNVVDEDLARQVRDEEEKLKMLRKTSENHVVENGSAIEKEEEHLRSILDKAGSSGVYVDDEEARIDELIRARAAEVLPAVPERDVEYQDENIKLDRAHIVQSTIEGETKHETHIRGVLDRHDSHKRSEAISHKVNREVEDTKLRDLYATRTKFQKQESELLLRQNTRKNLALTGGKEGKRHFRTVGGLIQFTLHESGDFAAQNNSHNLSTDFAYIHQRKRHVQHSDCILQRDAGQWILNKDSDYLNVRVGVYDFDVFEDVTGGKFHSNSSDCSIANISRKHLIPAGASIGQDANRHIRSKDSTVENLKSHDLNLVSRYQNRVRGHDLCPEGVFVQRAHKMHLPLAHTTEFRNSCTHYIPPSNSLINRYKGLDMSEDCVLAGKGMFYKICDDGAIVQKGLSHSLALTGSQDEQDRQYSIPLSGSQDENRPSYTIPGNHLINRIKSCFIPAPGNGDLQNKTKHSHHSYKKFSPWKPSKFSISSGGSLSHESSFGNHQDDFSWSPCPLDYDIFDDLSIDEDYLNELESDDEYEA